MNKESKTLKITGYSEGDRSVGIGECYFEIDLGLFPKDVDNDSREFIIEGIIRDLWELHDNGDLFFSFSDEKPDPEWGYKRKFTWLDSKEILRKKQ